MHLLTRTGIITTPIGQTLTFASALTRYVYYVVYLYSKRIILPNPMKNWKRAILKTVLCVCCFLMDIDTSDRIKRRVTKMIPELRDLSCEELLKECGLTTLETRRLRGNKILGY